MFGSGGGPSLADIAAVTGNNRDGGGWGDGNGWWVLIILFALFGWGRGGWGGNEGGGTGGSCCAPATCADLQRGFDNQTTQMRFNGIDQGLAALGYDNAVLVNGVNQNIMQSGYETRNAITQMGIDQMQNTNALSRQFADCCCENRMAVAQLRYDMATDTCAIQNTINNATRDMIENDNANWRALDAKLTQMQMDNLKEQLADQKSLVQSLNLAASQANQNRYLVDTLRPCPIPAYQTCNPWANQAPYGCCTPNTGCCN